MPSIDELRRNPIGSATIRPVDQLSRLLAEQAQDGSGKGEGQPGGGRRNKNKSACSKGGPGYGKGKGRGKGDDRDESIDEAFQAPLDNPDGKAIIDALNKNDSKALLKAFEKFAGIDDLIGVNVDFLKGEIKPNAESYGVEDITKAMKM